MAATLKVGRLSLSTPLNLNHVVRRDVERRRTPTGVYLAQNVGVNPEEIELRGREQGTSAQTTMDSYIRECKRRGAVYCSESSSTPLLTEGYYQLEPGPYEQPGGRPKGRPWEFVLVKDDQPLVARQAEDDEVAGTATADVTAEEGSKVVYTPTTSEVLVLDPRNVSGAEKVNLPAGDYRVVARVQAKTTVTVKLRAKFTNTSGTAIATGSQVTVGSGNNDIWYELDLGTLTIPAANDKANWYEVHVQDPTNVNDVWIDRVYLQPA